MLFSELYSAYYNTVAAVLRRATDGAVTREMIREASARYAFGESCATIEDALMVHRETDWCLLDADGNSVLDFSPTMPMTTLQKRWLKAITLDARVQLFGEEFPDLEGVDPLFTEEDFGVCDRFDGGDNYTDENYIRIFRAVLDGVRHHRRLTVEYRDEHGNIVQRNLTPVYMEYSEREDKFRVVAGGTVHTFLDIASIVSCEAATSRLPELPPVNMGRKHKVVFTLTDERNALVRVLTHFAHYKKEAVRLSEKHYRITVEYREKEEDELISSLLSFGPFVKVEKPTAFIQLISERLNRQIKL